MFKKYIQTVKYMWRSYTHCELFLDNPLYIIRNKTVRRLFVIPKLKWSCGTVINLGSWSNALFGLYSCSVSFKEKHNKWVFEEEPFVQLNLFGLYVRAEFRCPVDTVCRYGYWESIFQLYCDHVCNNKPYNLYNIISDNTWDVYEDDTPKKEDMTAILTSAGYTRYREDFAVSIQNNK